MKTRDGFTVIELLILTAIVGAVFGIALLNGREVLQGQERQATVRSVALMINRGATAAASRGVSARLSRSGDTLTLTNIGSGAVLRTMTLPPSVSTNLPEGDLITFTAPGRLLFEPTFPLIGGVRGIEITADGRRYDLLLSIIGEVKVIEL